MTKILLAPDSFKGSLSAKQACQAMELGIRQCLPRAQIDACPLADGGEGLVQALLATCPGEIHLSRVMGPTGQELSAPWAMVDGGS
ncbi:MAG: glycerate kinase, partial [Proteobacteria bacterium]|nr:glycerate kinase [Pseudomonadota bacterium]